MRYWHQTWMPIWGHPELLAKSDQWFIDRLQNATHHAAHQGQLSVPCVYDRYKRPYRLCSIKNCALLTPLLPTCHQLCTRSGYEGARWGKMLGENNMWSFGHGDGTKPIMYWESPNNVRELLPPGWNFFFGVGESNIRCAPLHASLAIRS